MKHRKGSFCLFVLTTSSDQWPLYSVIRLGIHYLALIIHELNLAQKCKIRNMRKKMMEREWNETNKMFFYMSPVSKIISSSRTTDIPPQWPSYEVLAWRVVGSDISTDSGSTHRTVESLEPEMMKLSSYWRQSTEPVWPVSVCWHSNVFLSHICNAHPQPFTDSVKEWNQERKAQVYLEPTTITHKG